MNNTAKKLADALEELLSVIEKNGMIVKEHYDTSKHKQALDEYRAEEGKQNDLVPLDKDKLEKICSKFLMVTVPSMEAKNMTLEFDDYENMINKICFTFGTRKVFVGDIMGIIDIEYFKKFKAMGPSQTQLHYDYAQAIYQLIYGESK